ncbi:MAG TPA: galactokinase [Streptosporangiaceae bacterium]|nr:galactokinase [Streptosporangiaceae bacterium]
MTAARPGAGAAELFARRYGQQPEGIWYSPGRVNLIGEHTDYNGGFALPFAISAGVCVAASRGNDGVIALASRQTGDAEVDVAVTGLAPGAVRGWAAYPAGVAWALVSAGHEVGGARLAVDADLALGAGLSSSAALECAAGLALADLYGLDLPRPALAAAGRRAENDFVGAPTGLMDQMAVLLCTAGHALLLDCRAGAGTLVPFDTAGLALLVIDTRARHELTDGGYGARRRACEEAARELGVPSLREVASVSELDRLSGPVLRRRAMHVVTENGRVLETARLLGIGQLNRIGPLLTASHVSLRDDFEVSWPEADVAVEVAGQAGALGARMTGGGFGGSVIALVPAGAADAVTAAVDAGFAGRGWRPPRISQTRPCDGAHRIR